MNINLPSSLASLFLLLYFLVVGIDEFPSLEGG